MSELRALVARRIRQYRASLGLTQPELAKRLRVSRNTVIEWEKDDGRSQPSWEQWEKMCGWTGIAPQWFVTDDSFNSEVVDFAVRVQALPDHVRQGLYALLQYQYQQTPRTRVRSRASVEVEPIEVPRTRARAKTVETEPVKPAKAAPATAKAVKRRGPKATV